MTIYQTPDLTIKQRVCRPIFLPDEQIHQKADDRQAEHSRDQQTHFSVQGWRRVHRVRQRNRRQWQHEYRRGERHCHLATLMRQLPAFSVKIPSSFRDLKDFPQAHGSELDRMSSATSTQRPLSSWYRAVRWTYRAVAPSIEWLMQLSLFVDCFRLLGSFIDFWRNFFINRQLSFRLQVIL